MIPLTNLTQYLGRVVRVEVELPANIGDTPIRDTYIGPLECIRSGGVEIGPEFVNNSLIIAINPW